MDQGKKAVKSQSPSHATEGTTTSKKRKANINFNNPDGKKQLPKRQENMGKDGPGDGDDPKQKSAGAGGSWASSDLAKEDNPLDDEGKWSFSHLLWFPLA